MGRVLLNRQELRDRVNGCWMGKSIGGTLGGPFEGRRDILDVHGYTTPPGEPLPNDDLDLQLVWLKAVQDRGPRGVNAQVLGEYWLNFIPPHWYEYGISKANQRAGLVPPLSGMCHNAWRHSNGAWIRTEIWACLAPGSPDLAIRLAYEDACVDHGAGEGTYAAMFVAAVESAAFVVADPTELIRIGLSKIPPDSRVARSIGIVQKAHGEGKTWQETRELVVEDSADLGWFRAPGNVAFVVIGWLYGGGDFGRSLTTAVNCGDDTDCTAATLGAIFGILRGRAGLPPEWTEPIGERILTEAIDNGSLLPPKTIGDLTDRVMALTPKVLASFSSDVEVSDGPTDLAGLDAAGLAGDWAAREIWQRSPYSVVHDLIHTRVKLDYGGDPEVQPGVPFRIKLGLQNLLEDRRTLELIWHLPEGWTVLPSNPGYVTLDSPVTFGNLEEIIAANPGVWPPVVEFEAQIVPGSLAGPSTRGILEIVAPGRPTVGLIPLLFLNGNSSGV